MSLELAIDEWISADTKGIARLRYIPETDSLRVLELKGQWLTDVIEYSLEADELPKLLSKIPSVPSGAILRVIAAFASVKNPATLSDEMHEAIRSVHEVVYGYLSVAFMPNGRMQVKFGTKVIIESPIKVRVLSP